MFGKIVVISPQLSHFFQLCKVDVRILNIERGKRRIVKLSKEYYSRPILLINVTPFKVSKWSLA